MGLGVQGEDVEDQPAAVDDLDVEQALEALLLGRAELVVGDQDVEPGLGPGLRQLLGLALAHVPVGVDVAAVLPLRAHDVGARRGRQGGELGQAVVGGPALVGAGVDGDEERLLDGRGEVDGISAAHGARRIPGRPLDAAARAGPDVDVVSRHQARSIPAVARGTRSAGAWRRRRCAARRRRSPRPASARRRARTTPPGSRWPRTPAAPGRTARAGPAPPPRGRRRTAAGRGRRSAGRARPGRRGRGRSRRSAPGSRAATGADRRPGAWRSRGPGRRDEDCAGPSAPRAPAPGSANRAASDSRPSRPRSASIAARTAASDGSASVSRPAVTARSQNPVPPARIPIPPRSPRAPSTPSACARKSATLNGWSGSTRSRP